MFIVLIWWRNLLIYLFLLIILCATINLTYSFKLNGKNSNNYVLDIKPGGSCLLKNVRCANGSICISGKCTCLPNEINFHGICTGIFFERSLESKKLIKINVIYIL